MTVYKIKKVYIDFEVHKIQEIRLIHAIAEYGIIVLIPKEQEFKFEPLKHKFEMPYTILKSISEGTKLSEIIRIDHETPKTTVGSIDCPLIFSKSIVEHLYTKWNKNREHEFSFLGLITPKRHIVIQNWLTSKLKSKKKLLYNSKKIRQKIIKKILSLLLPNTFRVYKYDNLSIANSLKGRAFPGKSWDNQYFDFLLNSQFVLCPSGDFIWSYRFFEAILCGAIPIIEVFSDAYEDFRFKTMDEDATKFIYNVDDAIYNYNLCVSRITIKKPITF